MGDLVWHKSACAGWGPSLRAQVGSFVAPVRGTGDRVGTCTWAGVSSGKRCTLGLKFAGKGVCRKWEKVVGVKLEVKHSTHRQRKIKDS